jgi:hypothetical protein
MMGMDRGRRVLAAVYVSLRIWKSVVSQGLLSLHHHSSSCIDGLDEMKSLFLVHNSREPRWYALKGVVEAQYASCFRRDIILTILYTRPFRTVVFVHGTNAKIGYNRKRGCKQDMK